MAGYGLTLQIGPAQADYLERRGGHSHRGKGTFNRSKVLARCFDTLRLYQQLTDPRTTSGLPEEWHSLIVRLLPEPWTLKPYEIINLEGVLKITTGFAQAAVASGIDPAALLAAVAALTPAEKITLADHAVLHQAPAAATASPEVP
jgi:hypothetical protein